MNRLIRLTLLAGKSVRNGLYTADRYRSRLPVTMLATVFLVIPAGTSLAAADHSPLVVVSTAQTKTIIRQVPLTGTVTSARVARLSAEVDGQVEAVKVEVGDRVEAGAALIKLDSEIQQLTLEALQASTRQASAELADAKRRYQDAKRLRAQKNISENALRLLEGKSRSMAQRSDRNRPRSSASRRALNATPCGHRSGV